MNSRSLTADVVVVGAGLAGLVAAATAYHAGRSVLLLEQEPEAGVGGQASWSFGGVFLVDSPEQRRLGVRDSVDLALGDWLGSAAFAGPLDAWARQWAHAYVHFAAGECRTWLHALGVRFFPLVQWAERGGGDAQGPGNSVPRFHLAWGTGPALVAPFAAKVAEGVAAGRVRLLLRHRATELIREAGRVTGVHGQLLAASAVARGVDSSRDVVGEFTATGGAVIVTSGGVGGNLAAVRRWWPGPDTLLTGVPAATDGVFQEAVAAAGGHLIHMGRRWHYPEGVRHPAPVWPNHGLRVLSGPSPLWVDAAGRRLPPPLFPGFDAAGTLSHLDAMGADHSWLVLDQTILEKELTLAGAAQRPELTDRDMRLLAKRTLRPLPRGMRRVLEAGADSVQADTARELGVRMNTLFGAELIDPAALAETVAARDRQVLSGLGKDAQVNAIRAARRHTSDKMMRVTAPHALTDPEHGPLFALCLRPLTRTSLGGLHTDLAARVLDVSGTPLPGLYAAGEAAGFGGGGLHGHRSLEGTFLGGCLLSGRTAGLQAARDTAT